MDISRVDNQGVKNFLIGPTKSGKTTLCHALYGSKLTIDYDDDCSMFDIELPQQTKGKIDNTGNSCTIDEEYYDNYCDLPGFGDTRGNANRLDALLVYYKQILKAEKFRFILVFEQDYILSGNSSLFLNTLKEVVEMFSLTPYWSHRIHLIVSKSKPNKKNIPNILKKRFSGGSDNFIIDGIISNEIKISYFNEPIRESNACFFCNENINEIKANVESTNFILMKQFKLTMFNVIFEMIDKISKEPNPPSIKFASVSEDISSTSDVKYLIINNDIDIEGENLFIDCPNIIVKAYDDYRTITLRGINPTITFSEKVSFIFNSESLILSTSNKENNIKFLEPNDKEFKKVNNYICLESICINNWTTQYLSHNNKFIDLIVYFNRNFGTINVDDKWNIEKINCDIQMKLHINECMSTKNKIRNNFKSLRNFKNVFEYLEAMGKERDQELIDFLEKYIINLPSIFQIFTNPLLFRKISTKDSDIKGLREIRKMLLKRYLNVLSDFKNNTGEQKIPQSNSNIQGYELSEKFAKEFCGIKDNFSHKNSALIDRIDNLMMEILNDTKFKDFLKLYNNLSITNDKKELYKYEIIGDITEYFNFDSYVDSLCGFFNEDCVCGLSDEDVGSNFFKRNQTIIIPLIAARAGYFALKNKEIFLVAESLIPNAAIAALSSQFIIGAGLLAAEIGINVACSIYKSGYYENSIKVDGKDLRINYRLKNVGINNIISYG